MQWAPTPRRLGAAAPAKPQVKTNPRIVMVAGEASGDNLGGKLIQALRQRLPDARFEGVCGPRMKAAG